MSGYYSNEPMLEVFIYETSQQIDQLEKNVLECEKDRGFSETEINEIFRIMHTIKGSAAMMMFSGISSLAHSIEDVFYYLREEKPNNIEHSMLCDLVLEGIDFIKIEIEKIKNGDQVDGDASYLNTELKEYLTSIKGKDNSVSVTEKEQNTMQDRQYYIMQNKTITEVYKNIYKAVVYFEDGCEMENIRAYTIIHNLKDIANEVHYLPEDIIDNDDSAETIRTNGFTIYIRSDYTYQQMQEFLKKTIFLRDLELVQLGDDSELVQFSKEDFIIKPNNPIKIPTFNDTYKPEIVNAEHQISSSIQSLISVNVNKLDKLMDLVGEMVIAEAMVVQNPDLAGLVLNNFHKAARQLNKITSEIQDMVMAIRMVPLSTTFQKMNRIVRDMNKKLHKKVELRLVGEETEVDKNIIEHISDPLMHLVRNAIDHGIEATETRLAKGKSKIGVVTLEAKNAGSDVLVIVKDDGQGLNQDRILQRARENGNLHRNAEEMSDKEIYNLILLPGLSTKDNITEFSGRGVGMDVVAKNIEAIGGTITVDSSPDQGSIITLKIPLTLAIIDGMNIKVGQSSYTIPTSSIKESFQPSEKDLFADTDGNEIIMVRGKCYPILRLHKHYSVKTEVTDFTKGIIIMVEQEDNMFCIFADGLVGQQQVVVKALPEYIRRFKKIKGLAGCTLLGDGSISLILDVSGLIKG